jgi:UDP-glucose 4-epimerase
MDNRFILVSGGAGYIGSHTCVKLHESGFIPVIVDDFRNSDRNVLGGLERLLGNAPLVFEIDLTNKNELRKVYEQFNFEGIIHFAAYKAVGESVAQPMKYYHNNLLSLMNCIDLCSEFGVNRFVFSSSCTVYGEPDSIVVDETAAIKEANSPYGASKQMCERIIRDVHQSGSLVSFMNLRYFNPVGAHPSGEIGELPIGKPNNLLPYITQTGAGILEQLTVFGDDYNTPDGSCIRDYIHVLDLADAHVSALEWLIKNPASLQDINIGTGRGSSVLEMIHAFQEISGLKLNWKFGDRRPGDVEQIYADVHKAQEVLNWKSKYTMQDAVRDAWNWEKRIRHVE